jgi:ketosteroid isomerase-like protein
MIIDDPATLAAVTACFAAYESALGDNDVAALDAFFWPSEKASRFGTAESLFGFAEIAAFRASRPPPGPRRLRATQITCFGMDHAVATTEFLRDGQSRLGRQTQIWVKFPELGWRIASAHVSFSDG